MLYIYSLIRHPANTISEQSKHLHHLHVGQWLGLFSMRIHGKSVSMGVANRSFFLPHVVRLARCIGWAIVYHEQRPHKAFWPLGQPPRVGTRRVLQSPPPGQHFVVGLRAPRAAQCTGYVDVQNVKSQTTRLADALALCRNVSSLTWPVLIINVFNLPRAT